MSEMVEEGNLVMTVNAVEIKTFAVFNNQVWEYANGEWKRGHDVEPSLTPSPPHQG